MLSNNYQVIISKKDGKYLVANLNQGSYLLVYNERFEALTYLNTHGKNLAENFAIDNINSTQLKVILARWNFQGIGIVEDPLIPNIKFLKIN